MEKPVTRVVAGFLHIARGIERMREESSAASDGVGGVPEKTEIMHIA